VRLFSLHWTFPKEDQWQSAVTQIVAQFGKLDILVNNAGISGSGERDHTSTEAWDRLMDINAKGVFLGMKYAVPEMRETGGGSILNISSISGFVGQESVHPGYNASLALSPRWNEVSMGGIMPGCTEFALMPSLACWTAAALVTSRTAPLEAL